MTKEEKRTVMAVFGSILEMRYEEMNKYLGSMTIKEMQEMYNKMKYEEYCEAHGIKYEDMDEEDFIIAHMEGYC